jgi:plastocyanin
MNGRCRHAAVVALLLGIVAGKTGVAQRGDVLHGTARHGGRPAADVVVWLAVPDASHIRPAEQVTLVQRNLTFEPRVLAVRVGTTVEFPNEDRVFHNVFSFRNGKRFDLGLYPVGASRQVTFDRPGVSRIFCNIHPNMAAYVIAVDSPYYAVSNRSGTFEMRDVPAGRYTYFAWRPGAEQLTGTWVTSSTQMLTVEWP